MAKNKRGGGGPKFKGQRFPRRKTGNPSGEIGANNSASPSRGFARGHGYTLAEEARNTASNRRGGLGRDARLRYKPVTFISAGLMNPLKDLEVQLTTTDEEQTQGSASPTGRSPVVVDTSSSQHHIPSLAPDEESPPSPRLTPGVLTLEALGGNPAPKSEQSQGPGSNNDSDSSEEVILFKGRGCNRQRPTSAEMAKDDTNADSLKLRELDIELQVVEETLQEDMATPDNTIERDDYIPLNSKPKGRVRRHKFKQSATSDEDAAIIADYMANIKDLEEEGDDEVDHLGIGSHTFDVLRDLGGTDSDAVPAQASSEDDTDDGLGDEADVEDRRRRRLEAEDGHIARILAKQEDGHMARMLAKQEEFGLGGDDVLLFDGGASKDEWSTAPRAPPRRKTKGNSKSTKITQKNGQFPSATEMADAFDELDLMDWHRPSLNNVKKGLPTFDVSDSELEEVMKSTWQKDRLKKAEKKKAREELRSMGLLGKNVNPDDLRIKYIGGMSLDDLANELEVFLLGSREQLVLPPFDRNTRRTIHALANKFKIKSQSAGKGLDRSPVLYRTKATLPFDQVTFDRTFGRIKQTWFPRVDVDDKLVNESRILKRAEAQNGKSRFKSSLTYRDGDVVGQHAAELGAENKGRAMLEKMGWSKGMALGTEDNKGIMVPITHVVKKSKAGLGDA
ncbi:hypothetical protein F4677DRAFT_438816 [Hypoxylon crocopeplum]|nr:hypothetical protein F4677DRAFT_438816 [Hypoxylon crocopeplum]